MQKTLCPHCMEAVQTDICPHCGKNIHYAGNSMHLPVGTTLIGAHPYVVGASIGQGGFGVTYIALDAETNEKVAIKEYFPTYCSARDAGSTIRSYPGQEETYFKGRERFLDEARMLQSLSDLDCVVNVHDYFEANNTAYLVMEYLEGSSLKDRVEKYGKMDARELLQQLKPLMADMEAMHNQGVIHRDIAPDNIILRPDGTLKLIDFGAARSYLGEKSMSVVVKKGFAPVEQYMRSGMSAATDVYALAATIYYCVTGIVPPDSADRQYGQATMQSPIALGASLNPAQEMALARALEVQPFARTQSMSAFAKELEERKSETFPAEELDLYTSVSYTYDRNPQGQIVEIVVDGRKVMVQMPSKVENGQIVRAPGKGARSQYSSKVGDLYVTVNIGAKPFPVKLVALIAAAAAVVVLLCAVIFGGRDNGEDVQVYDPPAQNQQAVTPDNRVPIPTNPAPEQVPTQPPATLPPATQPPVTEAPRVQAKYEAGDRFDFGNYYDEEIEWIVLEVNEEEGKYLVISRYVLDFRCYDEEAESVTWEHSDLRAWLNGGFMELAFSEAERAHIVESKVPGADNDTYGIDGGNDTRDHIFLPSIADMKKYFDDDQDRRCTGTIYAQNHSSYNTNRNNNGSYLWYLLRNPGENRTMIANVDRGGNLSYVGSHVERVYGGIRVMMYVDFSFDP